MSWPTWREQLVVKEFLVPIFAKITSTLPVVQWWKGRRPNSNCSIRMVVIPTVTPQKPNIVVAHTVDHSFWRRQVYLTCLNNLCCCSTKTASLAFGKNVHLEETHAMPSPVSLPILSVRIQCWSETSKLCTWLSKRKLTFTGPITISHVQAVSRNAVWRTPQLMPYIFATEF